MDLKFFQLLEMINSRLTNIEKNIERIDEKLDFSIQLQRNHLIRVKNGTMIDDNMILMGAPYNDLTPQEASQVISNPDMDYAILDITAKDFKPNGGTLEGALRIPYEDLGHRWAEIQSRTTPLLVICEDGLKSIRACELMVKKGYLNINNVSGGYRFLPRESITAQPRLHR
tara:strand:+ start:3606 stop:4118 length:513 start_codon:yes stop_codon:yes gene_type:complete